MELETSFFISGPPFHRALKEDEAMEEEGYVRVRLPRTREGEMFGIADQLLGASHIRIMCADGKSRLGRIPGKLKRRMWIREGDLVIVRPWSFQDEKADVVHRYTKTEATYLSRKGMIPKSVDIF
jgi:translation initiation factor 1A